MDVLSDCRCLLTFRWLFVPTIGVYPSIFLVRGEGRRSSDTTESTPKRCDYSEMRLVHSLVGAVGPLDEDVAPRSEGPGAEEEDGQCTCESIDLVHF